MGQQNLWRHKYGLSSSLILSTDIQFYKLDSGIFPLNGTSTPSYEYFVFVIYLPPQFLTGLKLCLLEVVFVSKYSSFKIWFFFPFYFEFTKIL